MKIDELKKEDLSIFFDYLTIHLSENGKHETPLFQPLSVEQSKLNKEWKDKFESGINKKYEDIGWRKIWVATNKENKIIGHIDIRPYSELNRKHRVLLGMGVDSNVRGEKIGQKLLEFLIDYCKNHSKICWLDLQVLSNNIPAIKLYNKMEFHELSNTTDMYRIAGTSYDYASMTLNVQNNQNL
jgi:ribosomal protein S18 acetylase RimI-like enzyme